MLVVEGRQRAPIPRPFGRGAAIPARVGVAYRQDGHMTGSEPDQPPAASAGIDRRGGGGRCGSRCGGRCAGGLCGSRCGGRCGGGLCGTRCGGGAAWLDDAPLYSAWLRFATADVAPFTIPGHKRRAQLLDPGLGRLLDADVPLYGGADSVKLTAGVLAEAERRAAELWGADVCRFSTGGSTHSNQVLCLAVGKPGDTVLVARNCHRSILSGLVLADLRPVWLEVGTDPRTGAPLGLAVETVEGALAAHPRAVALICTDPSYQGTLSDLTGIVDAAHAHGVPVLVDQAWGAHLGFHPAYPAHALQCGADALVTSAHKMLPAFSQASLVLARRGRIDADRLDRAFEATHTTSPSAAILASIDASRALLGNPVGWAALGRIADLVDVARVRLRAAGLEVAGPDDHPPGRFDPAKLVVRFAAGPPAESGAIPDTRSGLDVEAALLARGVPVEMADRGTLVAQVGLVDDASTLDRLVDGILAAVTEGRGAPPSTEPVPSGAPAPRALPAAPAPAIPSAPPAPPALPAAPAPPALPPQRMTPREAFFAQYEAVPRAQAIGRVSAELVAPYPPGVPVLVPGEEVTADSLRALDSALAAGNRIAYAADASLATLQVVARTTTR